MKLRACFIVIICLKKRKEIKLKKMKLSGRMKKKKKKQCCHRIFYGTIMRCVFKVLLLPTALAAVVIIMRRANHT